MSIFSQALAVLVLSVTSLSNPTAHVAVNSSGLFIQSPVIAELPPLPTPEPREYLKQQADREVKVCGYSTKQKCRTVNLADQLSEVIRRESKWGEFDTGIDYGICNREFGCGSGQGLIMLIVSTEKHCEEKLGREIDRANPYDSIDCGIYLLEQEGIGHWEDPKGLWGSGPY